VLGIAAVLVGTVTVALVAMVIAFPLALGTALYISEYSGQRAKRWLIAMIDLMASVPRARRRLPAAAGDGLRLPLDT